MASGIRGVNKLRRTLRRIEPAASDEVRVAIRSGAEAIKMDAIAGAPRDEGDLVRSIDYKLGRDGFTAVIGPGAKAAELARRKAGSAFAAPGRVRLSRSNQHLLFQYFKGYWYEFGTKGGNGVPPQPARPFMGPAFDINRSWILGRVRKGVRNALEEAARV